MRRPSSCSALMALGRGLLDRVGHGDDAGEAAVDGDMTSPSCPRRAARRRGLGRRPGSTPQRGQHARRCRAPPRGPRRGPSRRLPVMRLEGLGPGQGSRPRASAPGHDRLGQRVLGARARAPRPGAGSRLGACRRAPRRRRAWACPRSGCRSCRPPACRPGAMRSSASASLIRMPAWAPRPGRRGDRDRRRQPQRAGAGDDQHRHRGGDRVGDARLRAREASQARKAMIGHRHDRRHERAGRHRVGEPLNGRARPLRLGDHGDDAGQHGVGADAARPR
ncbi:MAG: hypothetical protein KatS3mg118_1283 [Paracoccaceae bacterium]|nr:MAG: hypothetical protein KatS3mg118_1283 [Paracoccaceae bacterium]